MPTTPDLIFSGRRVDPVINPEDANELPVNLKASTTYPAGTILGELIGTDEEQTITIDATGGTFLATWSGQTTAPVAFDATAAVLQAALEALSNIGAGNVLVWKPSALVFRVAFRAALGSQNVAAMTTTATGLTGGAGTAVVATAVAGVAGTPGTFGPYASGNSDGSQNPKCILRYDCITDSAGLISLGDTAGGEWGHKMKSIDAWFDGTFRTEDLVGLDANAVTKLGRLLNGTIYHGRIAIFGS
jgi:hypothetical protein